ncbi:hypothetical protein [uncultured Desulfovibrio sp.]|uniref:hypothetical protein n=1 Tax=uncultured Desulfovibrio sp. TaxID=167968 RepID=UPI0026109FF5|nr:hypothetical protein [uncultured Desulfovibrio sp.]
MGDNMPDPDKFVDEYLRMNPIDVLFLPVDESEHILSYSHADAIMRAYKPDLTIPIHYLAHGVNTALSTLQPCDPWIQIHKNIVDILSFRLTVTPGKFLQNREAVATFGNNFTRE